MQIRDFIKDLPVPPGTKKRFDCPSCGGKKTLSVSEEFGKRVFNCYKASCSIHGAVEGGAASVDSLLSRVRGSTSRYSFDIPRHFTSVDRTSYAWKWLMRFPACVVAIERGLVEVRYDPRQNRVVFQYGLGNYIGCVGRALARGVTPKWHRYDKYPIPGMYGSSSVSTAVLVEDAVSAAAVAATGEYVGVALLGTSIQQGFTAWAKFDKMIVALDKDASGKALKMHRALNWFKPTSVCLLDQDLKCYNVEEIRKQLSAVHS